MEIYNYEHEFVKLQIEWEKKNKDNKIFEDDIDFSALIDIDEELFFPTQIGDIYDLDTIAEEKIINVPNRFPENDLKCLQPKTDKVNTINSVGKKEYFNVANQDPENSIRVLDPKSDKANTINSVGIKEFFNETNQDPENSIRVLDPKPYLQLINKLLMDEKNTKENIHNDHSYAKKCLKSSENTKTTKKKNKNELPLPFQLYTKETLGSSIVFKCNICSKIYKQKRSITAHIKKIHMGTAIEVCKKCNTSIQINYIKNNMNALQNISCCWYCKKPFIQYVSINHHVQSCTADIKTKLRCQLCSIKSIHYYLMARHMKRHE